jgi:MSHA biogenesis protein MshO
MHGFTLVELVMTIVLLGIVSAILAPVIVSSVTAYSDTRSRNELVARGRLALERLTREIHQAIPNSLRLVTGRTDTIEFVTASVGGRYVDRDDTAIGSATCPTARRFRTGFSLTQLCLLNPSSAPAGGDILVIGNTSPTVLENGPTRVTLTGVAPASPVWTVSFATHTFNSASPGKHYNIVEATHEVGPVGNTLRWRATNGFDAGVYDDAGDLNGADTLLIDGVSAVAFNYNAAADGMLNVNLTLSEGNETVQLYEEIYVRNTP